MKRPNREITIFNLSMLDVMTGALGAVLIVMIVLLTQKIGIESMTCQDLKTELIETSDKLADATAELSEARKALEARRDDPAETVEKMSRVSKLMESISKTYNNTISRISSVSKQLFTPSDDSEKLLTFKIPAKVVMLIDLSGSMAPANNKYEEDRLSQIKAALKMIIAAMDERYWIDIVYFPAFSENIDSDKCKDFKILPPLSQACKKFEFRDEAYDNTELSCYKYGYLEGKLTNIYNEEIKHSFYRKIDCLRSYHDTPTWEALEFVLTHPDYKDAEGIILYSDGEPDYIRKNTGTREELLESVKKMNTLNKQIFTVGVGTEFANNEATEAVDFLKKLAEQNEGFYIGF
ncbi:MAG: hypothetical protein ACOCXW_00305 [Bacteroidota bacterium]